jgi:hypothetical protein
MCDMTGLPFSDHPMWWRTPVTPQDLDGGSLHLVCGAAVAGGTRADAVVTLCASEVERRSVAGLGSVGSLVALDALLSLPWHCPVWLEDLGEPVVRVLRDLPRGCVTFDDATATREIQVPATVAAAVVRGHRWRAAFRRAASFSAFTQRIVVLPTPPSQSALLEAQLAGVGIWSEAGGMHKEHLAPEVFKPMYFKAAGWRFAENALSAADDARLAPFGPRPGSDANACLCC